MQATHLAIFTGIGGIALFIYGMLLMTDGLKQASGPWFRKIMARISAHRLRAYFLGTAMGAAMHSTATIVMTVGFINAGLLSLASSFPIIAGANLGTSLAMQLIAFDKAWMWAALAAIGLPLRIIPGNERRIRTGQALMALALIFLGMRLMSESVHPFRDALSSILAFTQGHDWPSMLLAAGGAMIFTAIIQSSGATIGVLFSLTSSGILTDMVHVVPLVVGAHIGTCFTALISSIGTSQDARRGAMAHLYFNLITGALSFVLLPVIVDIVTRIGGPPIRQVANIHTLIMVIGGLVLVPATGAMVAVLHATLRFKGVEPDQSFLTEDLVHQPALALDAGDKELSRLTRITRKGFAFNRALLNQPSRHLYHYVRSTEDAVDLIRSAMRNYLIQVARFTTESPDIRRLQWMNLFLIYLERISDHNENLADLSLDLNQHLNTDELAYARTTCGKLYDGVEPLLQTLEQIWITEQDRRIELARRIREFRSAYLPASESLQNEIISRIAAKQTEPITGFFLTEYLSEMDRIVRHTKKIAGLLEKSHEMNNNGA